MAVFVSFLSPERLHKSRLTMSYKTALLAISTWLLERFERLYPLVPYLPPREIIEKVDDGTWQEPDVYYFLDDPDPRLQQRWRDVLTGNRCGVSFWRRRQAFRRTQNFFRATAAQE